MISIIPMLEDCNPTKMRIYRWYGLPIGLIISMEILKITSREKSAMIGQYCLISTKKCVL